MQHNYDEQTWKTVGATNLSLIEMQLSSLMELIETFLWKKLKFLVRKFSALMYELKWNIFEVWSAT